MRKILFLILVVLVFSLLGISRVKATGNVYGWAWAENIGWISFNKDGVNGIIGGGGIYDYGVNIETDGKLSGYAWAGGGIEGSTQKPTIGWIKFDPAGPYPTTPNYSACVDLPTSGQVCDGVGDYKVSGWARACSVFNDPNSCSGALNPNRGGWDGWINLIIDVNYGIFIDSAAAPAQFHNWAWGGDDTKEEAIVGWKSFNCAEGGNCGISDYKVVTTFVLNKPPRIESLGKTGENCCIRGDGDVHFEWIYVDEDGDPETRFQFQIDDDPNFNSREVDRDFGGLSNPSGTVNSQAVPVSVTPGSDRISFGKTYYWRVKVYDNQGGDSGWVSGDSFDTFSHALPAPDLEWSPEKPVIKDKVEFNSANSICYDSSNNPISCVGVATFSWTMPGTEGTNYRYVDGTNANFPNPKVIFLTPTRGNVRLEITDDMGACSATKSLGITLPLPKWKEIPPVSWFRNYFASLISFFFPQGF